MISNHVRGLNFALGETADAIRETVHNFSSKEIAPRAAEIDKSNQFPHDLWKKFGDLGILGMTAEEEYGGTQMGYLAHIIAMEEISRGSASGYAGFTLMPADSSPLTAEYKINMLNPAHGEKLVARARVIKPGKTLVITQCDVFAVKDGKESLCATMLQTLMVMRGVADGKRA